MLFWVIIGRLACHHSLLSWPAAFAAAAAAGAAFVVAAAAVPDV